MASAASSLQPAAQPTQPDSPLAHDAFVCRQEVLDRSERIAGYEFCLNQGLRSRLADERVRVRKVQDDLLIRSLGPLADNAALGRRAIVFEIAPTAVGNPALQRLAGRNTIVILSAPGEEPVSREAASAAIAALRERGVRVGWRLRPGAFPDASVVQQLDLVQMVTGEFDGLDLTEKARQLAGMGGAGAARVRLLASDVRSEDEFRLCYRAGFDLFRGPFVASRENWHPPKSDIDRMRVIQLLNRLRAGAENAELADALRYDAVLTYKMLRYINSPALGLSRTISRVEEGLAVLGHDNFYRWLSLLLFDVKEGGYAERALFEQALVRARLMEQLAHCSSMPGLAADQLFLTGLFSLLDEMLGVPIQDVLAKVVVSAPMAAALINQSGPFAPFLALATACESAAGAELGRLADACGVTPADVNAQILEALSWCAEVGGTMEAGAV